MEVRVDSAPSASGSEPESTPPIRVRRPLAWALAPLLSVALFLSGFGVILAPAPWVLLSARLGSPRACALALAVAGAMAAWVSPGWGALFAILVLVPGVLIVPSMRRTRSLERGVLLTLTAMFAAGAAAVWAWSAGSGLGLPAFIGREVESSVATIVQALGERGAVSGAELEALKTRMLLELPSGLVITLLVSVVVNALLALRLDLRGTRSQRLRLPADFTRSWRAPEWLVWPTLVAGATWLGDFGRVTDAGVNVFRTLMAVYAFVGLSVLAAYFAHWRLRPGLRLLAYALSISFLLPLVLSLGFFDLWFDFRKRIRQSDE